MIRSRTKLLVIVFPLVELFLVTCITFFLLLPSFYFFFSYRTMSFVSDHHLMLHVVRHAGAAFSSLLFTSLEPPGHLALHSAAFVLIGLL